MAGGCGVGAFCSFCGKCGRVFNTLFDAGDVPVVLPPGVSSRDADLPAEGEAPAVKGGLEDESEAKDPSDSGSLAT